MKKNILNAAVLMLLAIPIVSCIYELPDSQTPAGVTVEFTFDLAAEMPEMNTVTDGTKSSLSNDEYNFRYLVKAYRQLPTGGFAKKPLFEAQYTKDEVDDIHYVNTINLQEGTYRILTWVDYIAEESVTDLHYNTSDFTNITIDTDEYIANTELKDVFIGECVVDAKRTGSKEELVKAVIELYRPVAKIEIITNDLSEFIKQQSTDNDASVSLDDFHAKVTYRSYLPDNFNMISGKPDDSISGISFKSSVTPINDEEAILGFDYVLIPEETVISVSVAFYSNDGTLLTDTGSFDIPLKRGHVTKAVKKYLTGSVGGGVNIETDFDNDYDIPLN